MIITSLSPFSKNNITNPLLSASIIHILRSSPAIWNLPVVILINYFRIHIPISLLSLVYPERVFLCTFAEDITITFLIF